MKKNRERQKERNARRSNGSRLIAKMDASNPASTLVCLPCELVISREDLIAKKDVIRAAVRIGLSDSVGAGG